MWRCQPSKWVLDSQVALAFFSVTVAGFLGYSAWKKKATGDPGSFFFESPRFGGCFLHENKQESRGHFGGVRRSKWFTVGGDANHGAL